MQPSVAVIATFSPSKNPSPTTAIMTDVVETQALSSAYDSQTFGEDTSFHIDQPVGSMSISPCGRDVVLGSKQGLHIIDLDSPYSPPRYLPHHTSWEVADVQWSPFASRPEWVISTSNQKALVWNLAMPPWQNSIEYVLHGHTRAITDINFSAHKPHILATCAVDSFVHCWDLRTPARPSVSFSDWFAGATQVKWNRQDENVIASSHDKFLRIWDCRMGAHPVRSIEAHYTKIYGIDWNRHDSSMIVTCSLDKSIKFWDYGKTEDLPERTVETGFPVWRARHTPFGWGILAMPQRGHYDLHLYDRRFKQDDANRGNVPAVARFPGHKAPVKEFLWRPRGTIIEGVDHREFQLVTWGADRELRLHRVIPETMGAIGYERGKSRTPRLQFTRRGAKYQTFRDEPTDEGDTDVFSGQYGLSAAATALEPTQSPQSKLHRAQGMGMSKISIPQSWSWIRSPGFESRVGMHGRTSIRQDMNPITWMKNVKITSWESETLGEEISHVGQKFAKVSFESVDMKDRKATISMHGPWAQDHSSLFLKVDMQFPKDYPRLSSPVFNLQKTALMTDDLSTNMRSDLQRIADTHVEQKRGCLEAVLRYLLREQSAEEIIHWILEEPVESSMIMGNRFDDDLSSDEDDEVEDEYPDHTGLNSSELLNANVRVPVAKACGALWADNGKLVCFFPPKRKEPASFLDTLNLRDIDRSRSERVFERFGRLQATSPGPKTALRTGMTADDAASDISETSSTSSSSSSSSSDVLASLPAGFLPPSAWRGSSFGLQRSRSADQSQRSTNGKMTVTSSSQPPTNIISIHSLEELLPAQFKLALEYRIFGAGSEVCAHNSLVAEKFGSLQAAHVWKILALILQKKVVLESITGPQLCKPIVVKAESPLHRLRRHDSGVGLASGSGGERHIRSRLSFNGRIWWGGSPLTSVTAIPDIFKYYECLGDIQMLAMLSCVLFEPKALDPLARNPSDSERYTVEQNAPGFSVSYYPCADAARTAFITPPNGSSFNVGLQQRKALVTIATSTNSTASSAERAGASLVPNQFSAQGSPPVQNLMGNFQGGPLSISALPSHPNNGKTSDSRDRDRFLRSHTQSISLSSSPSDHLLGRLSNPNLAVSLSRASLSNLVPAYPHSPPNDGGPGVGARRLLSQPKNPAAIGWIADSGLNSGDRSSGSLHSFPARPAHASQRSDQQISPIFSRLPSLDSQAAISRSFPNAHDFSDLSVEMKASPQRAVAAGRNQQAFTHPAPNKKSGDSQKSFQFEMSMFNCDKLDQGDGAASGSASLLDPKLDWKYRAYRAQYANLLCIWGLDVHRKELLMFDSFQPQYSFVDAAEDLDRKVDENDGATLGLTTGHLRSTFTKSIPASSQTLGLRLQKHCLQCGESLSPVLKNGVAIAWSSCVKCSLTGQGRASAKRAMCSICQQVIQGLLVPCLNCGHASCINCSMAWFGKDGDEDSLNKQCPAGCGCTCPQNRIVELPWPEASASPIQYSLPGLNLPAANSEVPVEPAAERLQRVSLMKRSKSNLGSMTPTPKGTRSRSRSHTARSISGPPVDTGPAADGDDEDVLELGAGFGPAAPGLSRRAWASDLNGRASVSGLRGA